MKDKLQRRRYATILRAYADKVENGSAGIDYVLRSDCSYTGCDEAELDLAKQEVVDNVEVNLRDLGPDCDVDEIFGWDDLGIYVPIYSPRFSNVRPACALCYPEFEFFADVTADFVDVTKEDTENVPPFLCTAHVEDAAQVDALAQRPARHRDAKWRTFTLYSDLGAQSFEGRITHAPCSMSDLFDEDGRLSQRYVIRSVLTRDGELWIDMSLASDARTHCGVRLEVRPFVAAFGASFHELRVEDGALP